MREGCPGKGRLQGLSKVRMQGGARRGSWAGAQVPQAGSRQSSLLCWCFTKRGVTDVESDCKAAGQQGLLLSLQCLAQRSLSLRGVAAAFIE